MIKLTTSNLNISAHVKCHRLPSRFSIPCVCAQLCLTDCDSVDYSPPGFSVYGIFQARILEWAAISSSRESPPLKDWTHISCIPCFTANSSAYHFINAGQLNGEGNDKPHQYSCLENPRDGGAWWAAIYGVTQSRTRLKWLSSSSSSNHALFNIQFSRSVVSDSAVPWTTARQASLFITSS